MVVGRALRFGADAGWVRRAPKWLGSPEGQSAAGTVQGVAGAVATYAPAAGPIGTIIAAIAGTVAAGAGALAEYGRKRKTGALIATVSGVEQFMADLPPGLKAQLVDALVKHQGKEGTAIRDTVVKVLEQVKAANGKAAA